MFPFAASVGGFSPLFLPGLAAWYDASDAATVLTSVGPDVPATNGQTVRRWVSRHNPAVFFDQSVLANQPVFTDAATGLTFNGTSSFMDGTATMADVFRNRGYGYIFAVAQDTDPTGGDAIHPIFTQSTNAADAASIRASLRTRNTTNVFTARGRRLDSDSFVGAEISPNSSALTLLVASFLWAEGNLTVDVDGGTATSVSFGSGAGNSQDLPAAGTRIGSLATNTNNLFFPGNIRELILVNQQLTAEQILATRRYLQRKWNTPALP